MEFQRSIIVPAGKVITIYISNGGHTMSDNCVTLRQSFDDCWHALAGQTVEIPDWDDPTLTALP